MAENDDQADQKPAGKSGGGVMGLAILAMGSLAAAFATVYMLTPATASENTNLAACAPGDTHLTPASHLVGADRSYVELPEILITIGSEPASRYLKLRLSVVTSKDKVNSVRDAEPVLVDAFVNYLRSVELSDFENPAFYTDMRAQLSRRAELVLGGAVADGVLITEFLLR
ncbi:MAG: flagellar basal body-associated FliL family protein [Hyphomonadaceae bacterium]|nr:flagellar basal body-associated FliL family protein [Hyphomonadaceae bacterium]